MYQINSLDKKPTQITETKPIPPRVKIKDGILTPDICDAADPDHQAEHTAWTKSLERSLGIKDLDTATLLFNQAQKSSPVITGDKAEDLNIFLASIAEMKPRDLIETQLCGQLIVVFDQIMNLYGKNKQAGLSDDLVSGNLKLADRLMRVYTKLLEALNRYRRKGEQRIVVERLTVESGAQAIVGSKIEGQGVRRR